MPASCSNFRLRSWVVNEDKCEQSKKIVINYTELKVYSAMSLGVTRKSIKSPRDRSAKQLRKPFRDYCPTSFYHNKKIILPAVRESMRGRKSVECQWTRGRAEFSFSFFPSSDFYWCQIKNQFIIMLGRARSAVCFFRFCDGFRIESVW